MQRQQWIVGFVVIALVAYGAIEVGTSSTSRAAGIPAHSRSASASLQKSYVSGTEDTGSGIFPWKAWRLTLSGDERGWWTLMTRAEVTTTSLSVDDLGVYNNNFVANANFTSLAAALVPRSAMSPSVLDNNGLVVSSSSVTGDVWMDPAATAFMINSAFGLDAGGRAGVLRRYQPLYGATDSIVDADWDLASETWKKFSVVSDDLVWRANQKKQRTPHAVQDSQFYLSEYLMIQNALRMQATQAPGFSPAAIKAFFTPSAASDFAPGQMSWARWLVQRQVLRVIVQAIYIYQPTALAPTDLEDALANGVRDIDPDDPVEIIMPAPYDIGLVSRIPITSPGIVIDNPEVGVDGSFKINMDGLDDATIAVLRDSAGVSHQIPLSYFGVGGAAARIPMTAAPGVAEIRSITNAVGSRPFGAGEIEIEITP